MLYVKNIPSKLLRAEMFSIEDFHAELIFHLLQPKEKQYSISL